ncbi:hypothetical protein FisN_24Lh079 [Fistulifera solaris]|uniref:Uncharacterized protein n=1 Tax=Fistulifera solaris TaxID=1519565 RepID=A0A1Z5KA37_FISSO|nr:hypothetical protein FisN_24Lh079 [Fistulifera solaris]|eukprot:GAX22798.1 hypothetical protein FisN_24Lh079 [Fistulifera solaris]
MMSESEPDYQASDFLLRIHSFLSIVRKEYSTDFADLFKDETASESYRDGLVYLSCLLGCIIFVWTVVLITLKCKGHAVGCASGAFGPKYEMKKEDLPVGNTDSHNSNTSFDHDSIYEIAFRRSHIPSGAADTTCDRNTEESVGKGSLDTSILLQPSRRERRTQVVFLIFALLTILCVPLAHVFFFLPLKQSSSETTVYVVEAREIVAEVQQSINAISTGMVNSLGMLEDLPRSENDICPANDPAAIEQLLGFNLAVMIDVYEDGSLYLGVKEKIGNTTKDVGTFVEYMHDALILTETTAHTLDVYLWLIPGALLSTIGATVAVTIGAVFSWRRKSSQRMQNFLSYLVLPCLLIASLVCWSIAIASAMGSAVAADACTAGDWNGSPAATIQDILSAEGVDTSSFLSQLVRTYTMSCTGSDPTDILATHGMNTTALTEEIWQYLVAVDSIGRDELNAMCGGGNSFTTFLQTFQDLVQQLENVSRSLESASLSLSCPRINAIYEEAVNQTLCMQSADSLAYGFILFLTLGVTTMVLISLRASWGQVILEDKIYEEHEVAENMIVDEHEEYLLYISRYKHEWETYDQANWRPQLPISPSVTSSATQSASDPSADNEQNVVGQKSKCVLSPISGFNPYEMDQCSVSSLGSGKISFLSLQESPTQENHLSSRESRNPDNDRHYDDGRGDEERIINSTGESMELRLPSARYLFRPRPRPEPDYYIESTPGVVKFVLEVEDTSLVHERVDQLSRSHHNRPLTPTRSRDQKVKELAMLYESPANGDFNEC